MEQRKRAFGQEESYEELSEKYTSMHLFATRYVKYHRMIQPHMAAAGISAAESHVLILITDHPGLTVSEMAKMMGCTAGDPGEAGKDKAGPAGEAGGQRKGGPPLCHPGRGAGGAGAQGLLHRPYGAAAGCRR